MLILQRAVLSVIFLFSHIHKNPFKQEIKEYETPEKQADPSCRTCINATDIFIYSELTEAATVWGH